MKNFAFRFLGVAMLGTACAFVFSGESSVGKQVDDSLAASIRGGGECNNSFLYFDPFKYCAGGTCKTQRPNTVVVGQGTEGLDSGLSCGAAAGCSTYTGPKTCARPATEVTAGVL